MLLKLLKFFIVSFFIFGVMPVVPAEAAGNFSTDYHVLYQAEENGITHSVLNVSLTNTSSEYYASSYKVQLGFDKITNIQAFDPDGPINPIIEKNTDGYTLTLNFNQKVVGLNKKLNFTLSFDTPDVAKQTGDIWEINIPGIANPDEFNSFTVEVKVPPSFGKPAYTKPLQPLNNLVFDKSQLGKSGISISFGESQVYSFHLVYHIKNESVYPKDVEIALPPTTNYQTVFIQNINPKPNNVILDKDKNWLAHFSLLPMQKIDVSVDGKAEVRLTPEMEELSDGERRKYLEEKSYWSTTDPAIKKLAQELKTPDAIYKFVVTALKYDFSRVADDKPRLGAVNALKSPDSAVCLEYTDLFITLARAAGIPAREINGYAYTENSRERPLSLMKDVLHAWPEYYDKEKKTWVMVDPTWGSTTGGVDYFSTLDFDHFVFVRKGMDSSYPIPAGGYKFISDKNQKDISIEFARNTPAEENNFSIVSSLPEMAMSGLPITGDIHIKNMSQNLIPGQVVRVLSADLKPNEQTFQSPAIPPFGTADIKVTFKPESFLTNKKAQFTIRVNDQAVSKSIDLSPLLIRNRWIYGGGIAIGIFCIILFIFAIKARRL
jgi:transglutaminase-like putative cysteine protease